jgi:hypothetical protein
MLFPTPTPREMTKNPLVGASGMLNKPHMLQDWINAKSGSKLLVQKER